MKLFYWSPFLSNIATVDSVINSINSLKRYGRRDKYRTFLIDASGEWEQKFEKILGINIIKLYKKKYYEFLPKWYFFKSRFSQLTIFICNFNPLRKLLIKENAIIKEAVQKMIKKVFRLSFKIFRFSKYSGNLIDQ